MAHLKNIFTGDDEPPVHYRTWHRDYYTVEQLRAWRDEYAKHSGWEHKVAEIQQKLEAQARHDWAIYAMQRPDEFKNACFVCLAVGHTAPSEALNDNEGADVDCCESCYVLREGSQRTAGPRRRAGRIGRHRGSHEPHRRRSG